MGTSIDYNQLEKLSGIVEAIELLKDPAAILRLTKDLIQVRDENKQYVEARVKLSQIDKYLDELYKKADDLQASWAKKEQDLADAQSEVVQLKQQTQQDIAVKNDEVAALVNSTKFMNQEAKKANDIAKKLVEDNQKKEQELKAFAQVLDAREVQLNADQDKLKAFAAAFK